MLFNSLAQSLVKIRPNLVCYPLLDSRIPEYTDDISSGGVIVGPHFVH